MYVSYNKLSAESIPEQFARVLDAYINLMWKLNRTDTHIHINFEYYITKYIGIVAWRTGDLY